jgi:phosphohistidine phosphatase
MSRSLYLLRHAHSLEKQLLQKDRDRELSDAGVQQCFRLGAYLLKNKFTFDKIFTSNAVRARSTTQLVADTLQFDPANIIDDDKLYEASVRTFLQYINEMDPNLHAVMCVGHNPTISYLAEYLTKENTGEMATGSLVAIRFEIFSWTEVGQGTGKLMQYIDPDAISNE